jgi:hypothetical protein
MSGSRADSELSSAEIGLPLYCLLELLLLFSEGAGRTTRGVSCSELAQPEGARYSGMHSGGGIWHDLFIKVTRLS